MEFEVIGEITEIEPIAIGRSIRVRADLLRRFGPGRWRKLKGVAWIRLPNEQVRRAELHWYEAHGLGRRELKWKTFVD